MNLGIDYNIQNPFRHGEYPHTVTMYQFGHKLLRNAAEAVMFGELSRQTSDGCLSHGDAHLPWHSTQCCARVGNAVSACGRI